MAKQVNLKNLQDSLARTKQYVDDKGGAMVYRTETVLFDGEASVSSTNNLNQSLANFDAVKIIASAKNTTDGSLWAMIEQEFGIDELTDSSPKMSATEYNNTSGSGATVAGGYTLTLLFTDTTFSITRTGNGNWTTHNPTIRKIYGINYVPMENYSTTEQVVGTWIDGRPVYQKTFAIPPGSAPAGGDYSFDFAMTGVDHLIDQNGCIETSGGQEDPIPSAAHSGQTGGLYWTCRCFKRANGAIAFHYRRYLENMTITGGYVTFKYTKASS